MTGKLKLLVDVDATVCMGSGVCTFHAPNTFALGDDGLAYVIDANGDPYKDIEEAANDCPTQAIRFTRWTH